MKQRVRKGGNGVNCDTEIVHLHLFDKFLHFGSSDTDRRRVCKNAASLFYQ